MVGVVKHIMIIKFKDETTSLMIDELIASWVKLASLKPVKAMHWGIDVSKVNLHQGFTHVFKTSFESTEGVAEYVSHPDVVEVGILFVPFLDKFFIIDCDCSH